jgi:two-component system nitrate/nitrite response regulator NarL
MKYGCVIIADIHHSMLEGIRGLLDSVFETTIMVASIESLREATTKLKPDLVIMDMSMPASGARSVVREFIDYCPGIKVIVMSVYDEQGVAENIIGSGALGFVLKRQTVTDLIPAVEEVMRGQTYISQIMKKANSS